MSKKVVIIGAGGHGKVIADIVLASGDSLLGFLDDKASGKIMGFEVLGKTDSFSEFPDAYFVIAVGNNKARKNISETIKDAKIYTAVHPSASVSRFAEIGEGSVICAGSVIAPEAKIGAHCIINHGVDVDHECVIGDFTHISPNACVCGQCKIGECTHIGAGASVKNNIEICSDVILGAGAAAVKNIDVSGTYAGVPAKRIK